MSELSDALREAYPGLDRLAQLGAAMELLGALSVRRTDVAISLVGGRVFIGSPQEPPVDADRMAGTYGIEPITDDWLMVARMISEMPRA